MYQQEKNIWQKHLDFIVLDIICLQIAYVAAFMLRHGKGSIFLARALPCVPFGLVSYAAGLTSVRFIPYFLSTAAGKIFPTLLYGLLGSALLTLPPAVLPAACAAICLPFLVFFVLRRLHRKRLAYCEE